MINRRVFAVMIALVFVLVWLALNFGEHGAGEMTTWDGFVPKARPVCAPRCRSAP